MAETTAAPPTATVSPTPAPPPRPRRFRFDWIFPVLFLPRRTFAEIAAQTRGVWIVPILLLTLAVLVNALATGYVNAQNPGAGIPSPEEMGPAFEWYTPEQQAQLQQQMAAMQSPVFNYVLRSFWAVLKVWFGWLFVGGILHLMLTLFGGRSTTGSTMNVVAWASLPLVIGALVQAGYLLIEKQPISGQGLAGFAPSGEGVLVSLLASFLALITIWVLWQIVLLVIGVRQSSHVSRAGAWGSVLITLLLVMGVQAVAAYAIQRLQALTVTQGPMF